MFQISIITVIFILFIHWVADFVLQSNDMATKKSTKNSWLLAHTGCYSLVWLGICHILISMNVLNPWFYLFAPITFVFHTIQDYITSRISSKLYKQNKIHDFFVCIGFDQFLHFVQLLITYYLL